VNGIKRAGSTQDFVCGLWNNRNNWLSNKNLTSQGSGLLVPPRLIDVTAIALLELKDYPSA
jgi:hypothetical protein